MLKDSATLLLYLLVNLNSFLIGYLLGKNMTTNNTLSKPSKTSPVQPKESISIDDTKFVTDINTANLEKKYSTLGDTTQSSENISQSINKLKNLKG